MDQNSGLSTQTSKDVFCKRKKNPPKNRKRKIKRQRLRETKREKNCWYRLSYWGLSTTPVGSTQSRCQCMHFRLQIGRHLHCPVHSIHCWINFISCWNFCILMGGTTLSAGLQRAAPFIAASATWYRHTQLRRCISMHVFIEPSSRCPSMVRLTGSAIHVQWNRKRIWEVLSTYGFSWPTARMNHPYLPSAWLNPSLWWLLNKRVVAEHYEQWSVRGRLLPGGWRRGCNTNLNENSLDRDN